MSDGPVDLPYGAFLTRTLPTLSRSFRVLNRFYVSPAIKAGLGPLHANPLTRSWKLLPASSAVARRYWVCLTTLVCSPDSAGLNVIRPIP